MASIYDSFSINYYRDIKDKRVVLLQSGGLDSCVLASLFSHFNYEIHHLFVNYGFNSANRDLRNVNEIVKKYGGKLHIVNMSLPWLQKSTCLVNGGIVRDSDSKGALNTFFAKTYVPMRNTFLISIASSLCESLEINYLATAVDGAEDFVTHQPVGGTSDKHPTFIRKLEEAINEGSSMHYVKGTNIRILTPLIGMSKEEIINMGEILRTDFSLSNSCYSNTEKPCGVCSACITRKKAFELVGIKDPLLEKFK